MQSKKQSSLRDIIIRVSAWTEHPSAVPLQSLIWDASCSRAFGRSLGHMLRAGSCPGTPCPSPALDCSPNTASWDGLEPRLSSEAKESVVWEVSAARCCHRRRRQGTGARGRDALHWPEARRGRKSKPFVAPWEPNAAYLALSATGSEPSCPRHQRHKRKTLLGFLVWILTTDRILAGPACTACTCGHSKTFQES